MGKGTGVGVASFAEFCELLGILMTCPMDMEFGFTLGLAAVNALSEILNFCAIWLNVSPDLIVYVKGVGEGRGVLAETTIPSGRAAVALGVIVR